MIKLISFGFRLHDHPPCDHTFDLRLIQNPYCDPQLRGLCGMDKAVQQSVLSSKHTISTIDRIMTVINSEFIFRRDFTIGLMCTGGVHRSVAIAEIVAARQRMLGREVEVIHRDLDKWFQRHSKKPL